MNSPRQHGPWQIVSRREVYQDPWVRVERDEVIRPDGVPGTYCVVHIKAGVCVLAIDEHEIVHLTEEFHYGVGRVTLEAVSGGTEPPESELETARRELAEELGITAHEWHDLGTCDPLTSALVSPTRLFVARQLSFGPTNQEGTETIRRVAMPLSEAVERVLDSRISHGPSAVLILKAWHWLRQR